MTWLMMNMIQEIDLVESLLVEAIKPALVMTRHICSELERGCWTALLRFLVEKDNAHRCKV